MRDFRDGFETLSLELMEHPDIEVLECDIASPADAASLDEVELSLGHALPTEVRAFYATTDGVRVRWVHRHNPRRRHVARWDGDVDPRRFHAEWNHLLESQREDGHIALRSIRETFLNDPFADGDPLLHFDGPHTGDVTIEGVSVSRDEYSRRVRVFDAYGSEGGAAFIVGPTEFLVVQGTNSGASYEDGHVTDLESYLEFLLASRGLTGARNHFYNPATGESRRRLGPTTWTASDYGSLARAYDWEERSVTERRVWETAAQSIVARASPPMCPTCGAEFRYACDSTWIDATRRRLWIWCGACRRYGAVALAGGQAFDWPGATFNPSHPSIGYWLDHANAAWSRKNVKH